MEMLGDFQNPQSMKIASDRFLAALAAARYPRVAGSVAPAPVRDCAHDSRYSFLHEGKRRCRQCSPRTAAEVSRERRLPEMIENTQTKLDRLLKEAKRRGIIV